MRLGRAESSSSNALRRLRGSVSFACALVSTALLVQIFVWAFAAFTEVRFTRVDVSGEQRVASVVQNRGSGDSGESTWSNSGKNGFDTDSPMVKSTRASNLGPLPAALDVNLVYTEADSWMRTLNQLAFAVVVIGLVLLAIETSLGVVVASSTNAAGVGLVTRAQLWSILLIALAIPWAGFLTDFPIPPMVSNYSEMIATTESYRNPEIDSVSGAVFYGRFLLMPLAVLASVNLAGWFFWQGASTAVASGGPTAYEEAIEKEARDREAGNVRYGGRARGALEHAVVDDRPLQPSPKRPPKPEAKAEINIGLLTGTASLVNSGSEIAEDDDDSSSSATAPVVAGMSGPGYESEDEDFRRPI